VDYIVYMKRITKIYCIAAYADCTATTDDCNGRLLCYYMCKIVLLLLIAFLLCIVTGTVDCHGTADCIATLIVLLLSSQP